MSISEAVLSLYRTIVKTHNYNSNLLGIGASKQMGFPL